MKIIATIVILASLLFVACKSGSTKVPEGVTSDVLSGADFKTSLQSAGTNAQLIDVRTPAEVAAGMIPGAINIDYQGADFKTKMGALDKEKPVYVYCAAGGRSGKAAKILQNLGFKEIHDLKGGYGSYK